jgi:Cu-Zn family superoxide dismutase
MPKLHKVAALLLVVLAPLWVCASSGKKRAKPPSIKTAVCIIHGLGDHKVSGVLHFTQRGNTVHVTGRLTGLKPGKHGFHVHEFGDCTSKDGSSAGTHFDLEGNPHGGPGSKKRHIGDLGNIEANGQGVAEINKTDKVIRLSGRKSILGRSIIVHEKEDDLKDIKSAGGRIGCGVIGVGKPEAGAGSTAE